MMSDSLLTYHKACNMYSNIQGLKVINYNTILILRPQNYDEPLSCIYTCMVYYSPLKSNIDLMQIYGTSAKT